jgi:predicted transcriptional regulator
MAKVFAIKKEDLYKEYITNKNSTLKIAEKYNVTPRAISYKLKEYNIPTRSLRDSALEFYKEKSDKLDKDTLYQMYVVEQRSCPEIGKLLGVSHTTVARYLKNYGFDVKKRQPSYIRASLDKDELHRMHILEEKSTYQIAEILGVDRTTVGKYLKKYGIKTTHKKLSLRKNIDKDKLYNFYVVEKKSIGEIAKIFNVASNVIRNRLKELNVVIRPSGEAIRLKYADRQNITSENRIARCRIEYYNWRKKCLKRDNFTCQVCGKHGGKLHIHHLNNFSEFKELRYKLSNGITLCKNCHEEFHKIFGVKNNTKEQIEDFKKIKGVLK